MGPCPLVPELSNVALLLAASFMVLWSIHRCESRPLAVFGKVVVVLLWVAAGLMLLAGRPGAGGPPPCRPEGRLEAPPHGPQDQGPQAHDGEERLREPDANR